MSRKAGAPRIDPDSHAAFQVVALANQISASASRTYLRCFGIGVMEWRVLALAARAPSITAAEICEISRVDKSPVSRAVKALVRRGALRSHEDADDSRRALLTLTPAGAALHDRMIMASLEREELLLAGLTRDERRTFFQLVKKVSANMRLLDALDPGASPGKGARRAKTPAI
jgi:DNA-binding MarR family transcriptional regulator